MITITGKTWQHREALKEMRARWNGNKSCWQLSGSLNDIIRGKLQRMDGVRYEQDAPLPPKVPRPYQPPQKTIEEILTEVLADKYNDEDAELRLFKDTKTNKFGDDETWFNYFADKNPISFFGFSSLAAMVKFVKNLPSDYPGERHRGDGWETSAHYSKWCGTSDMDAAIKMARDGWPEGVEMAQDIVEHLNGENALEKRRKYGTAGGSVSVGRMLAGNPMHMRSRPKQPGRKIVRFFVEGIMSAVIEPENAIIRAAVVAAIADVLEMNGFSCEIISVCTAREGLRSAYQVATTIKAAGEPLNINDTVFALGHPSYLRRLVFACAAADEDLRQTWQGMGMPVHAFTTWNPTAVNEIYVKQITYDNQRKIDNDASLLDKAMQIWDLIVRDDLPIKLNREDE